jgi:hypothetical protein
MTKTRTKVVIAGVMTTALLLGVGVGAHAQNGVQTVAQNAGRQVPAAIKARMDERRATRTTALHDVLAITPAQEGAWSAYQVAVRPARFDRQGRQRGPGGREARQDLTTPQRLDRMVEQANARHAELLTRASATRQFYGQLSPAQKKAFDALPQVGPGRGGPGFGRGERAVDGRMGPGPRAGRGGFGEGRGSRGERPEAPAA